MNLLFTQMMKPFKSVNKLQIEYNRSKLQYVLDNIETVVKHLETTKQDKTIDQLVPTLKWFLTRRTNPVNVTYNITSDSKLGRLTPKNAKSYIGISRPVRHFLARDLYWDIDIDNVAILD